MPSSPFNPRPVLRLFLRTLGPKLFRVRGYDPPLPLSLAWGAGSQMLQPLAIAVIGGILISMILSLIITPAIQFYLTREG